MVDGSKVRGIQNYATELSSATGSESRNDARITVSKNTRYWHPLRNGRSQGWKTHNRSSDKGAMSVPAFKETLIKFDAAVLNGRPLEKSSKLPQQADKVEEMLNAMIPPREITDSSGTWVQHACKEPASRTDVSYLAEQLDKNLSDRRARESGICPVREEIYGQCLDEIIRHVTLDGPERGLLLMRTRDEIKMTIDSYKALFTSSITFGIKKHLTAEQGIPELEAQAAELEREKTALEHEVFELKAQLDTTEKNEAERRAADEKQRKEEIDFLQHKKQQLEAILTAAK